MALINRIPRYVPTESVGTSLGMTGALRIKERGKEGRRAPLFPSLPATMCICHSESPALSAGGEESHQTKKTVRSIEYLKDLIIFTIRYGYIPV